MHDEKTRRWGRYFTYILSIFDYELYWPCSLLVISRNFHYISFLIFAVLRRRQKAVSFLCKNGFYDKMTDDRLSTDQEGHNLTTLQKYFLPSRSLANWNDFYRRSSVQCISACVRTFHREILENSVFECKEILGILKFLKASIFRYAYNMKFWCCYVALCVILSMIQWYM